MSSQLLARNESPESLPSTPLTPFHQKRARMLTVILRLYARTVIIGIPTSLPISRPNRRVNKIYMPIHPGKDPETLRYT